jgi:hypothetical protein
MGDDILDDLLAALREVAAESDPDSVADSDSADSDEDIAEDADSDQEEDAQSFQKPKIFNAIMLLEKLEIEAELQQCAKRSLEARQLYSKPSPTHIEQKNEKLFQIRRKASEVEQELRLNRKLEAESKRLQRAKLQLYKANKTAQDRMELDADTKLMANWASRFCAEAGTDWREQATVAFQNKRL